MLPLPNGGEEMHACRYPGTRHRGPAADCGPTLGRRALTRPAISADGTDQPTRRPVRPELFVDGQEGQAFTLGLGEEDSVERILWEGRKFANCQRVRAGDRESFVTVVEEALP